MRISNYPLATNLSATDKLLGTKAGKTHNFSLQSIVDYAGTILTISAGNITSESINVGLTSGYLPWNRLVNIPFASSANGIITSSDWNTFNNKVSNLNILSAYLPLSGGILTGSLSGTSISAVDIISNYIYTDYIDFNISATPTYKTGRLHWDDTDKTLDLDLDGGSILQIGQETLIRGQNNTGSTILNGQLVYINGAQGNRPTFAIADADVVSASPVIAIATQDISNNNTGFFTAFGLVRDINTSQFPEGTELFLSTSAGIFTDTEPSYPNKKCSVGYVIRSHASQGSIFFNTKYISKYDQSVTTLTELNYVSTVSSNIQTQLTNLSARTITSADVPQLPPSKISTNTTNRFVTDSQIAQWDANISGTSAIVDLEYSLILEANKNKLYFLSGATTNIASAAPADLSFTKYFSPIYSGKREKEYSVIGPSSGTYQATIVFYGTDVNRSPWVYPDNCIIATITSASNSVSAAFSNKLIVWGASLTVDSGTIPSPGISATIEV